MRVKKKPYMYKEELGELRSFVLRLAQRAVECLLETQSCNKLYRRGYSPCELIIPIYITNYTSVSLTSATARNRIAKKKNARPNLMKKLKGARK